MNEKRPSDSFGNDLLSARIGLCCAALGPMVIVLAHLVGSVSLSDIGVRLFFFGIPLGCFLSIIALILSCFGFRFWTGMIAISLSLLWWVWIAWLTTQRMNL
jgi:hypothetical protein